MESSKVFFRGSYKTPCAHLPNSAPLRVCRPVTDLGGLEVIFVGDRGRVTVISTIIPKYCGKDGNWVSFLKGKTKGKN